MLTKLKPLFKFLRWLTSLTMLFVFFVIISPVLPTKNIPKTFIVVSGSMEPAIKAGSLALIVPIAPDQLSANDIIAFASPEDADGTIIHRIKSVKSTDPLRFETKGDNNDIADDWDVVGVGVLGKHIFSIPYLGHSAAFIRKPFGFAIMVGLPALLFIVAQILNIKKTIKEEIKKGVDTKNKKKEKGKKSKKVIFPVLLYLILSGLFISSKIIWAAYIDTVTVSGVSISIKDFVAPPVPVPIFPDNNSYQNASTLFIDWSDVSDYENQNNPVTYDYELFLFDPDTHPDPDIPIRYKSYAKDQSRHPATGFAHGTPEDVYWWHVRACDAILNCSDWTSSRKLTVDNTLPVTTITNTDLVTNNPNIDVGYTITDTNPSFTKLHYSYNLGSWQPVSQIGESSPSGFVSFVAGGDGLYCFDTVGHDLAGNIETDALPDPATMKPLDPNLYCLRLDQTDPVSAITAPINSGDNQADFTIPSWDGRIEGTAYDASSAGLDYVEISIQKDPTDFWNGSAWVTGSETGTRVTVTGTAVWSYQLPTPTSSGAYTVTSHAVDKAGNVENSATISFIFDYQPPSPPPRIHDYLSSGVSDFDQLNQPSPVLPLIDFDISFHQLINQLTVSFTDIPINFGQHYLDKLEYGITYNSLGIQKGLFGQIMPDQINLPLNQIDITHFLGVCSTFGQVCLPDQIDLGVITIELTGLVNNCPISIIKTIGL